MSLQDSTRGRRLSRRGALVVGGAAAFVAACGGSDSKDADSSGATGTAQSGPGQAGAATAQPKRGGNVNFAYANVAQNLDMHKLISPTLTQMASLVTNRLLRHKTDPSVQPNEYVLGPDIASAWEQVDQVTYSFKLRPDVKWQNKPPYNGRALVAKDIIRSFERQASTQPGFIYAYLMDFIASMQAPDDRTLVVKAKEPFANALDTLGLRECSILPMESVDAYGHLEEVRAWVGTGPYMLKDWRPGVGYSFERNPDYWEQGSPYVDKIEMKEIIDESARLAGFLAGELDQLDEINPELVETIKKSRPNARIVSFPGVGTSHYAFTQKKGPFKDARVRRAWELIVDRPAMVQSLVGGKADFRVGPVASGFGFWGRSQDQVKANMTTDLAEAKRLLAAAGYENGFKAGILGQTADEKARIEWAVQQGKKVGIEVVPQVVERTVYLTAQREHNFDLGQIYGIRAYYDPDEYIFPLFYTGASKNYFDVSDPVLDDLIRKERSALARDERKKVLDEIDSRWTKDFNHHTFLFSPEVNFAVTEKLQNWQIRAVSEYSQMRYAWKN
jgi:peptide/nickel transport system substrate-binding protein